MTTQFITVPISSITIAPQVRKRFDDDAIERLAASIREQGLLQPLRCRKIGDMFRVEDGECRLRACLMLGHKEIDILVVEASASELDALACQLTCNLQRTDLNAIEKAEGIRALMDRGSLSGEQAAKRLGLSASDVSRTLAILKLSPTVLAKVASGEIPADAAYQLSRVADPTEQATLASEVAGGLLTRDGLARKLRRVRRADEIATAGPSRVTAVLGSGRSVTVVSKGLSLDSVIELLETLVTRARKAKANGLSLQTFIRTLKDQAAA